MARPKAHDANAILRSGRHRRTWGSPVRRRGRPSTRPRIPSHRGRRTAQSPFPRTSGSEPRAAPVLRSVWTRTPPSRSGTAPPASSDDLAARTPRPARRARATPSKPPRRGHHAALIGGAAVAVDRPRSCFCATRWSLRVRSRAMFRRNRVTRYPIVGLVDPSNTTFSNTGLVEAPQLPRRPQGPSPAPPGATDTSQDSFVSGRRNTT